MTASIGYALDGAPNVLIDAGSCPCVGTRDMDRMRDNRLVRCPSGLIHGQTHHLACRPD